MSPGEITLKSQDVTDLCPSPTIDTLVIIPDTANLLMLGGKQSQPQVLGDIRVLILVYQKMAKPILIPC